MGGSDGLFGRRFYPQSDSSAGKSRQESEAGNGRNTQVRRTTLRRVRTMTAIKVMRLASLVTAINVLVASGFSIVGIVRPQYLVPAGSVPTQAALILAMYAAARTIPLALFALGAICKQSTPALLLLGAL